jgi:hypothetical protein
MHQIMHNVKRLNDDNEITTQIVTDLEHESARSLRMKGCAVVVRMLGIDRRSLWIRLDAATVTTSKTARKMRR